MASLTGLLLREWRFASCELSIFEELYARAFCNLVTDEFADAAGVLIRELRGSGIVSGFSHNGEQRIGRIRQHEYPIRVAEDLDAVGEVEPAMPQLRDQLAHDHAFAFPRTRHGATRHVQRGHALDEFRYFAAALRDELEDLRRRVERVESRREFREDEPFV